MGVSEKKRGLASRIGRPLLTGALSAAALAPAPAAADGLLTLSGIIGPSQVQKGAIDIVSYSQAFSNTARLAAGTTGTAGKVTCGQVIFEKFVDASSADLVRLVATGEHASTGVFTFRRPGANFDHYSLQMFDVVVTSVKHVDTPSNEVVEQVSMLADHYVFRTASQDSFGQLTTTKFGWDCVGSKRMF